MDPRLLLELDASGNIIGVLSTYVAYEAIELAGNTLASKTCEAPRNLEVRNCGWGCFRLRHCGRKLLGGLGSGRRGHLHHFFDWAV